MKSQLIFLLGSQTRSHPARGEWIEILWKKTRL